MTTSSLAALGLTAQAGRDVQITGLSVDSRKVAEGHLFAALPGSIAHGADFIPAALANGATAILTDAEGAAIAAPTLADSQAALVIAEDPTFTRQMWEIMGLAGVNLGTTGVEGAWEYPLNHTTPEPITLHRVMAEAARHDITHVAMEASSHGLDQRRLDGVLLTAAGFTNFTQDHLDYHETFEAYFAAKMGLFTRVLAEDGVAVVNIDDPKGVEVADICIERGQEVISVGRASNARLRLVGQRFDPTGQDLRFEWQDRPYQARLDLIGGFQADNVLLAAGLCIAAGAIPGDVFNTFPHLMTVRGRMQHAATRDNGAAVFVDYAHTPDAVETALTAMRPHVMGRIVVIVGAGGDRDATKRPLMGPRSAPL